MSKESLREDDWRGKEFSYFSHRSCELYPCHLRSDPDSFNCLFCYCPLYSLGVECGGNFTVLSNGVKDCTACVLPHDKDSFGYISSRFNDIVRKMDMTY